MSSESLLRSLLDVQNDLRASSEILNVIGRKLARVANAHEKLLREYANINNVVLPSERKSPLESIEKQVAEHPILAAILGNQMKDLETSDVAKAAD